VTVQIAGQRYSLRSDSDDHEVKDLAAFVDGRIKDIHKQTRTADSQAAAILAALQIAEDLFKERRARAELKSKIREKGKSLLHFLEREARV
jgi:cell division protein ZapA